MAAFYTRRERKSEKRAKSACSSAYLKRFNILIISGRFLFFLSCSKSTMLVCLSSVHAICIWCSKGSIDIK